MAAKNMGEKFKTKKSASFGYFLLVVSFVITLLIFVLPLLGADGLEPRDLLIVSLILLAIFSLFLWIWLGTYYIINANNLIARSGPLKWRITISEIKTIHLNQKTINGIIKLTCSWNSIEVKYKKYGSVFISPEREEEFVKTLLKANAEIVVK